MREIKFRQPIFLAGKFYQWHYWGFIEDSFIGAIHDKGKVSAGDSYQYTGLHDRNGKEIYEGDIVNCHLSELEDCPAVDLSRQSITFKNGSYLVGRWYLIFCSQFEVIGNIYENSELLQQQGAR